jgi:MFS transporter, ACS family, tartrate transporter
MTGIAAAASIAAVNTIAQFGGLIGPWLIGLVKDSTGSFTLALVIVACFLLIAAAIAATMRVTAKAPTDVRRLPGDGEIANPPSPAGTDV